MRFLRAPLWKCRFCEILAGQSARLLGDDSKALQDRIDGDLAIDMPLDVGLERALEDFVQKCFELVGLALRDELHAAVGQVPNRADDVEALRDFLDPKSKSNALDATFVEHSFRSRHGRNLGETALPRQGCGGQDGGGRLTGRKMGLIENRTYSPYWTY